MSASRSSNPKVAIISCFSFFHSPGQQRGPLTTVMWVTYHRRIPASWRLSTWRPRWGAYPSMGPCPCQWSGSSPGLSGAPPRRRRRGRQSCCRGSRRGRAPTAGWQGEPVFFWFSSAIMFFEDLLCFSHGNRPGIKIRSSGRNTCHKKYEKESERVWDDWANVICISKLVIQPISTKKQIMPFIHLNAHSNTNIGKSQLTSNSALDSKKRSRSWVSTKKTIPLTSAK